jgi:hypothetical protein
MCGDPLIMDGEDARREIRYEPEPAGSWSGGEPAYGEPRPPRFAS